MSVEDQLCASRSTRTTTITPTITRTRPRTIPRTFVLALAFALAPTAVLANDVCTDETRSSTTAFVNAARGVDLLSRGELAQAIHCLENAQRALPESGVIARDLALAYAHDGRLAEALEAVDRAIALGDLDPEAHQLRAILLAELGRSKEAIEAAQKAATWEGELIAAAIGDGTSAHRVAELVDEDTARGALASLVLAAHAGGRGEKTTAALLAEIAEDEADKASAPIMINAARALSRRIDELSGINAGARLRTSLDHATNPLYQSELAPARVTGLRLAFVGEGAIEVPFGTTRVAASLRVDQHIFLTERQMFRDLDLTAFSLAASVDVPISRHPTAALIGLRLRVSDAFGNLFRVHYATSIEGGPNLVLPMSSLVRLELGFYGVAIDFIDLSPSDSRISSLNRDHVGQRASLAMLFESELIRGRIETMFLRDDALGDAFDAVGGVIAGRVEALPGEGIALRTGVALTVREFGPVGDLAIIGPAATRTELRTVVELGARIPITDTLSFVVEDVWIQNNARRQHAFTENVLSLGMEQTW